MRKAIRTVAACLLVLSLSAVPAMADSYSSYMRVTSINSVRMSIYTGELQTGDQLADDASSYVTVEDNDYYQLMSAEWLDSVEYLKVGDQPRIRIYLNAYPKEVDYEKYTKIWLFHGGYSSSNVHVTGADFISCAVRDSGYTLEVTVRARAVKGNYDPPTSVYWTGELGKGAWTPSQNESGVYDVMLYRGESVIKQLKEYRGNYYNFYPYMTKPGDYSFRVRSAISSAAGNAGAKASEYEYSTTLLINENQVSDGTGQTTADENGGSSGHSTGNNSYPNGTGNENIAGWMTDSTGTYFRYPNGEYAKNGWLLLDGSWYLFDGTGKRLTGWQQNPSHTDWFYLDPSTGVMKTGWLSDGGYWYYLESEGTRQGARISGWRDVKGKRYYFNPNGIMVTGWYEVEGRWYYFYPQSSGANGNYGHMAVNTQIGDFHIGADGTWQN